MSHQRDEIPIKATHLMRQGCMNVIECRKNGIRLRRIDMKGLRI